jgi:rhamnosyl/mannosyltransferase
MAFGKPMVSTRLPRSGVPCVNRHDETGLLVEPRDSVALAVALNRLAVDPVLYRRLADGAARSFRNDHDIASTSRAYAELIRAVLARDAGREAGARPGIAPPLAAKRG